MDKSHLFSRTARKPRSERNCSGFFLCRGIIKRCTPLGSKCTPHRPFVKWYRGVKRKRLHGDNFRITVEPVIVKKYMKTLANRSFYKKKLDTNQDTHCIKIGVQLWCERWDLNPHDLTDTSTSSLPVCRFQHARERNLRYYNKIPPFVKRQPEKLPESFAVRPVAQAYKDSFFQGKEKTLEALRLQGFSCWCARRDLNPHARNEH